jgi:hypothetical protein
MIADTALPVSRLDIRMGVPDIGDDGFIYPVATLLIDGQDPFAAAGKFGHVAWPAQLILTGDAPLLSLTAEPGPPEQQARTMYEYLLMTPADRWPSTLAAR